MALGGNTTNVSYTPFNKQSFGFSNELLGLTSLPNSTDVVTLEISTSATLTEGHVSTPSVGTAISTFSKGRKTFFVKGERDDVNAVMNQLVFFPPPNNTYLNWNVSSVPRLIGYTTQQTQTPPSISDILFYARVYKADGTFIDEGWVRFQAQIDFVYYHPYMSSYNQSISVTEGSYTRLDFGNIGTANMTDRNITITCEAFTSQPDAYNTPISSTEITFADDDLYIGDKKSETPQGVEKFRFTGSVEECQRYLDSIQCVKSTGSSNIYLRLRLLDGLTNNNYFITLT